jgi:hypothetical protein
VLHPRYARDLVTDGPVRQRGPDARLTGVDADEHRRRYFLEVLAGLGLAASRIFSPTGTEKRSS